MSRTTDKLVENSLLTIVARVAILVVSTVALPSIGWILYNINDSVTQLKVVGTELIWIKRDVDLLRTRLERMEDRRGWTPGSELFGEEKLFWPLTEPPLEPSPLKDFPLER